MISGRSDASFLFWGVAYTIQAAESTSGGIGGIMSRTCRRSLIVRLLFLGACSFGPRSGPTTATASVGCPGKDPIAVVRTYYAAAARHDALGAQACLTPQYRRKAATFIDPDWKNIEWIHIFGFQLFGRLLNDADTETGPAPARLSLVTVSYIVRWKRVGGTADGPGLSFVDLAQAKLSSPWRIEEIGSGG
jgi:hypothetical protein